MNVKPFQSRHAPLSTVVTAALAAVVALGILSAVTGLFQREGKPLAQWAAAERACVHHAYQSEREACVHEWLAASQRPNLASK